MKNVWTKCLMTAAVTLVAVGIMRTLQSAQLQAKGRAQAQQGGAARARGGERTPATSEELVRMMKELSNSGRWGKDDQLGTVNLITPEKRKAAARLVQTGTVVSLVPNRMPEKIGTGGPGPKFVGPPAESSTLDINFDGNGRTTWVHERNYALTSTHSGAHLDAVCHVAFDGKTYNGHSLKEIASKDGGCSQMAIGAIRDKLVTRGILVDIPRMKGLQKLEPGTRLYKEDIEAFEKWANVKFAPGDAFFFRVGRPPAKSAGLDPSFGPFLKQRDIALYGADSGPDQMCPPEFPVAMHSLIIVALGMNMFDGLDLEALSETAAKLKRWEFMFVATPDASAHGTGSQISPIAIF